MATIAEMVKPEQMKKLFGEVQDTILEIPSARKDRGLKMGEYRFIPPAGHEVGLPLFNYVYREMLRQATTDNVPAKFKAQGYTHRFNGWLTDIIVTASGGVIGRREANFVAGAISATLHKHRLGVRPKGGKNNTWYMRVGSTDNVQITGAAGSIAKKALQEIEQQATKAKQINEKAKVRTSFDLSAIPLPDPNPDSVIKYVEKLVQVVERMNHALEVEQKRAEAAEMELETLQAKLDGLAADEWELARARLKEMVGRNG